MIFEDRAGNKLFINKKNLFVINKEGNLVNKRGVMIMLRRAHKAGKINFIEHTKVGGKKNEI